jgi:DNA polymerase elongation subunit (family B)
MKTYKIPVVWQMMGTVEVQAESLDDAVEKVLDTSVPLPEDGEYIEGSFEVDESVYSLQEDESLSDYYTVGSHVNVTFNTNGRFSGVIKGHNCGFIVVEDEDGGAIWEVEPHMVSFCSDKYIHD